MPRPSWSNVLANLKAREEAVGDSSMYSRRNAFHAPLISKPLGVVRCVFLPRGLGCSSGAGRQGAFPFFTAAVRELWRIHTRSAKFPSQIRAVT